LCIGDDDDDDDEGVCQRHHYRDTATDQVCMGRAYRIGYANDSGEIVTQLFDHSESIRRADQLFVDRAPLSLTTGNTGATACAKNAPRYWRWMMNDACPYRCLNRTAFRTNIDRLLYI